MLINTNVYLKHIFLIWTIEIIINVDTFKSNVHYNIYNIFIIKDIIVR